MSDSPRDDKKFVPIFNKTTGAASQGEAQAGKALNTNKRSDTKAPTPAENPAVSRAHQDIRQGGQSHASDSERSSESGTRSTQELDKKSDTSTQSKSSKNITCVSDIIKRFYASSGTPKRITEPALRKLEERTLSAAQRSELLDLAQREDAALARTVNLAFAAFEIYSNHTIRDLLLKFAIDAGRETFDLAMEPVDDWLPLSDEDRKPAKELFRRYVSRVQQVEGNKKVPAKEKKERLTKLRNLLFLSLIWQANQGWAGEEEILRFLRAEGVFTTSTHYPTQAREALLKSAYTQASADFSPLGWLSRQIENTKIRQASDLERLERDVKRLTAERDQIHQEHTSLRHEHDALMARVEELEQALHQEKESAQTTSVHLEDDKHRLRAQVTKALKNEVPRLEEALIALRLDPPKLHIVSHYVEDALDNIKKVLHRTEGE
ncbi:MULTISPECIES: hypothetical protein [Modicisalibacter]|uniref:Uncharacterized protein n=1 Tax=Modicisalibacter tunisiensis TaxID=390637 RepID=A0ABS7WVH8_9GAMM|nr:MULTISPECIES: hypothetical protein [Modicisalibacter]MBZ9539995.1 hypothetical protein [Modicisalibacter tunisiensis]MBZ9566614.1 hypothetical protein [Modicisalibacter tunisiensis]